MFTTIKTFLKLIFWPGDNKNQTDELQQYQSKDTDLDKYYRDYYSTNYPKNLMSAIKESQPKKRTARKKPKPMAVYKKSRKRPAKRKAA